MRNGPMGQSLVKYLQTNCMRNIYEERERKRNGVKSKPTKLQVPWEDAVASGADSSLDGGAAEAHSVALALRICRNIVWATLAQPKCRLWNIFVLHECGISFFFLLFYIINRHIVSSACRWFIQRGELWCQILLCVRESLETLPPLQSLIYISYQHFIERPRKRCEIISPDLFHVPRFFPLPRAEGATTVLLKDQQNYLNKELSGQKNLFVGSWQPQWIYWTWKLAT